jgi:hypothetical protein
MVCALVMVASVQAAHAQPNPPQDSAKKAAPSRRNRDVITAEELAAPERKAQSVLEVVRSLRPNFLSNRGAGTCLADKNAGSCSSDDLESGKVHASIDGNGVVSLDELSSMHATNVLEIRFLNPAAAMQKFGGAAHQGPVLLVKTM